MKNCVILAGGKSSRMHCDKALMPFGGFATLTQFQVIRLLKIFQNVYVSAKFDKFNGEFALICDEFSEYSPMSALATILSKFDENERVFILAVDTPFVSQKSIEKLFYAGADFDITLAKSGEKEHRLCGFYSSNLATKALNLCQNGNHKIGELCLGESCKILEFDEISEFCNLNFYDEYEKAISCAKSI